MRALFSLLPLAFLSAACGSQAATALEAGAAVQSDGGSDADHSVPGDAPPRDDAGVDVNGDTSSGQDAATSDQPVTTALLQGGWYQVNNSAPDRGSNDATSQRIRFDGAGYVIITDGAEAYCGESGTFSLSPSGSIHFQPTGKQGLPKPASCPDAAARDGSISSNDGSLIIGTAAGSFRYAKIRDVPKVFLPFEVHNGDLAGDRTLPGATVIDKADAICNGSAAKPDNGIYRAMLVDGVYRVAAPAKDWVLKPVTAYYRPDGALNLFTTSEHALANTHAYASIVASDLATSAWTGLGFDFLGRDTCNGWSTNASSAMGGMAYPGQGQFLFAFGAGSSCDMSNGFVCVGKGTPIEPISRAADPDLSGSWVARTTARINDQVAYRRFKFEDNQYTFTWHTSGSYCAETGFYAVANGALQLRPVRINGFGSCAIDTEHTENVITTTTELTLTRQGVTSHYQRAPTVAKVFITPETHNGDLAGDDLLPGANAIEKGDAFCQRSVGRPDGQSYKAVLVDGVNRGGAPLINWPLRPFTTYYQDDGLRSVWVTDSAGLYHPGGGLVNVLEGVTTIQYLWSGLNSNFTTGETCQGWTSIDERQLGGAADIRSATSTAVSAHCGSLDIGLICASQ